MSIILPTLSLYPYVLSNYMPIANSDHPPECSGKSVARSLYLYIFIYTPMEYKKRKLWSPMMRVSGTLYMIAVNVRGAI